MTQVEPVAVANALIAVIEAFLAFAVGWGLLDWTPEQVGLLMAVVVAIGGLIATIWARGQVTPVANPRNNESQPLVPKPE